VQTIRIADTTVIGEEGPDGRPLVEVPWTTAEVERESQLRACVEVIERGESGNALVAGQECRTLPLSRFDSAAVLTSAQGVFLGLGGIIELEDIAVRNEFFGEPDRHSLVLSLDEERTSGEVIPLGTQTHTIAEFPVVVGPGWARMAALSYAPPGRPLRLPTAPGSKPASR
jgi:hypothetical protein